MEKVLSPEQLSALFNRQVVSMPPAKAAEVTKQFKEVKAYDTMTSGFIRAYHVPGFAEPSLLVEEFNIETKDAVWRVLADEKTVDAFIEYRKEDYATMWGSCCYHIDYSAPFPKLSPL